MLGYSVFNLLHLQHVPWLPRFKGEGAGFGMEILGMLCVVCVLGKVAVIPKSL